jgi:nitrate reductase molybdenum cofactor assembly chaperone NarJ/NarW
MATTFKALSALLSYPTVELQQATGELIDALRDEALLSSAARRGLEQLIGEIADGDIFDLQERYVLLFDRTRSLSLHLFEHVHGESRDRGQAMIDLAGIYAKNRLVISATELPDFLPLFLEFLSICPVAEARALIGETAHIIVALGERLTKRGSAYASIFIALTEVALTAPQEAPIQALGPEPDVDPDNLAALDAAWQDDPVTFGPEALGSCKEGLIARIRAGNRPAARPQ